MKKDNTMTFEKPASSNHDLLTEVMRQGARQLLAAAINAEVDHFVRVYSDHKTSDDKARFVRNGYLPRRNIQTGIGDVSVDVPRVRDRVFIKDDIRFSSSIIPKYLRRSGDVGELLPLLYLKGVSTNDFVDALAPLVGQSAKNLSPGVISRLKSGWEGEYHTWRKRDLSDKEYVYWWADGINLQARMEASKDCVLVIMGVTVHGQKELIAIEDGYRESKASWLTLLNDLKQRGLKTAPLLAAGDGALGFWGALTEAYPTTRHQRCWFHKMGNVLDKLPKSQQSQAKTALQDIWMAATRKDAYQAFDKFVKTYTAKYPKAAECLAKDREQMLTFYDFPAEHWPHIRTTNPIESTFATVRHRTKKVKNCFSRTTILTMVFKLTESAQKRWNRLRGFEHLGELVKGVKFVDGIKQTEEPPPTDKEDAA